jgi:YceI-like domain
MVEFEVKHLWSLHTVRGRFRRFDGVYIVGLPGSEIELTIDAASADTGNAAHDKHLRSADFFDVAEYPKVRFTSKHITGLGNGHVHVSSELEVVGTTIPLAFDASVRVIDGELELEATTTVDQRRIAMSQGPLRQRPAADEAPREDAPRARRARIKASNATRPMPRPASQVSRPDGDIPGWRDEILTRSAEGRISRSSGGLRSTASPSMPACTGAGPSTLSEVAVHARPGVRLVPRA